MGRQIRKAAEKPQPPALQVHGDFHFRAILDLQKLLALKFLGGGSLGDDVKVAQVAKKLIATEFSQRLNMVLKSSTPLRTLG